MSENLIQMSLYYWLQYSKNHRFITPNSCNIFPWEVDLLSVTRAGYFHEFEIKITLADFKADSRKQRKHQKLKLGTQHIPKYFWYVIYGFELQAEDVPGHAGLIEIAPNKSCWYLGYPRVLKEAPKLNGRKITEKEKERLCQSAYYRFWRENETRLKNVHSVC